MNYDKLKQLVSKYRFDTDDLLSETALYVLENNTPEDKYEEALSICYKKIVKEENKHQRNRAMSLYNEDGDCLDDDLYFVDQSTVEQYGEGSRLPTELKEKGLKVTHTMTLINKLINKTGLRLNNNCTDSMWKQFSKVYGGLNLRNSILPSNFFLNAQTRFYINGNLRAKARGYKNAKYQ